MTLRFHSLLLLMLLPAGFAFADSIHDDPAFDEIVVTANDLFLNADFDAGINLIRLQESSRPEDPAVSYFAANGYWWKIFRTYIYDKEAKNTEHDQYFEYFLQQTIERSENLLKRNKQDVRALFYLGNAYSLKSRVKGLRGSYFSASRDAARGKNHLEEVLKLDPSQYDAYYNLGMYNYLAGALPGYAKVLKAFLFLPGGSKEKGLSLLKIASAKSKYFSAEAQLVLARFYADFEDQPFDALRIVDSFHNKYPGNAWFHYWKGTLYSDEINDYKAAEPIFIEIIQKCEQQLPSYTDELRNQSWLKLARVYARRLYPEKAIDEIKQLIAQKPTQPSWILPRAYLELGNVYDLTGMRKEAVSAYNRVLAYRDYRNFHELAKKARSQDYNQAQADIYRLNLEGRRLVAAENYAEAETAFENVLRRYPNNDQTLYALAEMHSMKGSYKEAADILTRILKRNPKEPKWLVPGIYVRLGQIYQARKQAAQARLSYEKALDAKFLASDDRNLARRALKEMAQNKSS